jgi:hypothetical protein
MIHTVTAENINAHQGGMEQAYLGLPQKFWSDTVVAVTAASNRRTLKKLQEMKGNDMPVVVALPETGRRLLAKRAYQACFVTRRSEEIQAVISLSAGERYNNTKH